MRRAPNSWTAGTGTRLDGGRGSRHHPHSLLRAQVDFGPLLEFLTNDDRPTFIIEELDRRSQIVFSNVAFKRFRDSLNDPEISQDLLQELSNSIPGVDRAGEFGGKSWFSKHLRRTWTIVQCRQIIDEEELAPLSRLFSGTSQPSTWGDIVEGGRKLIDWTKDSDDSPNPWTQSMKDYRWEDTPLGPLKRWPDEFRRLAVLITACPDPRMIYWGNGQAIFYNEAAAAIIGNRHPGIMGQRFVDVWGEDLYQRHMDLLKGGIFEGRSTQANEFQAILERNGMTEETYWNIHLLPVPGPNGHIIAAINEYTESTSMVFHDERRKLIALTSEHTALAESLAALWQVFLTDLGENLNEVSYACIYTADPGSQRIYHSEGSVGAPPMVFPGSVHLADEPSDCSLANAFSHAREAQQVIKLTKADGLPEILALQILDRGSVDTACVLPISSMSGQQLAFVIVGMNPRRPFTEETGLFVTHIRDLLSKAATIISLPEEQRLDHAKFEQINLALTQQLRITALKAEKTEDTFMRMARGSPMGMYLFSSTGEPRFVNDSYLDLLSMTRAEFDEKASTGLAWRDTVYPDDVKFIEETWRGLTVAKTSSKVEYRVLTKPTAPGEPPGYKWVENLSYPEIDDGQVVTVMGWLYDISHRKVTEALMSQRLEEALENKRASERFIDMTSHEMRNPLSAILQLADEISTSISPPQKPTVQVPAESIETVLDAAQTIMLCAQHQKNIVDDVLTISKLDSNLLVITPDKVDPVDLVRKSLKMYEAELSRADITAALDIHQSYSDLDIVSVMLDPSRVLQVIINLVTNAIKFTKDSVDRRITIVLSASMIPPAGGDYGLTFAAPRQKSTMTPKITSDEWGSQEEVYVQFAVRDTGKGLSQDEMKVLFHRFSQGNPRTYKQYGGSGLGLFISKELTELQGGQIGVQGEAGSGSTFTFYVKARRCQTSETDMDNGRSAKLLRSVSISDASIPTGAQATANSNGATFAQKLHVLIVEDNAINQRVMAQQLRRLGCIVTTADHGLDALGFLATTSFYKNSANNPLSIVLMDLEMPVMDGLTCISRIRQLERTGEIVRRVPVIAITANARIEQINTALEAGMDEVVTKPFMIRDLMPKMMTLVETSK